MRMNRLDGTGRGAFARWSAYVAMGFAFVFAVHAGAQAPASDDDLGALVGPIALYPDDLVAIVLPASTNPLQLVQADRYLEKRKADPKLPVDEKWDDAIKSLLNYPTVVKTMSADLDWTSALGEAVVTDQGAVLDAIQAFRRKAQAAGNLKSDGKQVVEAQQEIITIVPSDPQVIYVPQYNPATVVTVGVAPVWGYYPTPYPSYYYPYPPGAALATGIIWGAAIGAAWNGNRYGTNYGGGDININRNTNINTGGGGRANQLPAGSGGSAWKSNKQPGQVSNSIGKTAPSSRVGDARAGSGGAGGAGAARPGGGSSGAAGGGAGSARASAQPAGGAMSGSTAARSAGTSYSASPRDSYSGSANRGSGSGGDAFGGYSSGRQTQADSSRGASSRGSMSSAGARPSAGSSAGGARGGGGGGRGGGGGGRR